MDPEYQKKLYEMLQGKQIEENLEHAMEEHPESFGQVSHVHQSRGVVMVTGLSCFVTCCQSPLVSMHVHVDTMETCKHITAATNAMLTPSI